MSTDEQNLFKYFRTRAEDELISTLNNIAGMKELVIDSNLFRQIDRVTSANKLRSIGVKRIMRLESNLSDPNYIRVYFIRPLLPSLKCVIQLIQSSPRSSFEKAHILCVPRVQYLVKHLIECEDLLDNVVLASVPSWEVIYLDNDILSMEAEYILGTTYVSNDYSALSMIASSLVNIQSNLGKIPYVYSIGEKSKRVADIMDTLISSLGDNDQARLTSTPTLKYL
ncbi:hypothetical protein ACOME3_008043 [Neoechinorhynchus agilis]